MKKRIIALAAMSIICFLFLTCNKHHEFPGNFINQDCQVAEYHIAYPDYPSGIPFPFKKTYDASGKTLKVIECVFWPEIGPPQISEPEYHHIFQVEQQGRMLYMINMQTNKGPLADTVARITFNNDGRVKSCIANSELFPLGVPLHNSLDSLVTEEYIYRDNRVLVVKSNYIGPDPQTGIDSLEYDKYGNILLCEGNSYQYDYTRKAKQQFYCMDYMGQDWPFYLLQYLGFFPEITSPVNIRTYIQGSGDYYGYLTNHKFDSEGKLVSYQFDLGTVLGYDFGPGTNDYPGTPITILWNCNK